MFTVNPAPKFWADVEIPVPGHEKPADIYIEFKHKTQEQLEEWSEKGRALAESQKKQAKIDVDTEFIAEIVCNWENVDTDFSEQALRTVLNNYAGAGRAIILTYRRELAEGRRKN